MTSDERADQPAAVARLVAPDLAPRRVGHVVGQREEVEAGRAERVVERLGHRRVAQRGVLGVDVQVARVPAGLAAGGRRRVAGRAVRGVGERRVRGQLDLHPPGDLAVGVAERRARDRGQAELGRPAARPDRPGPEPARGGAGHVPLRARHVLRLAREALGGQRHVGMARAAPAAELALAGQRVAAAQRLVEPEVERVPHAGGGRVGLVEAVLDAHRGGPGRHVEGHEHVAALQRRFELAGDQPVRPQRIARARPGHRGGGGRREPQHEAERDEQGQGAAHGDGESMQNGGR